MQCANPIKKHGNIRRDFLTGRFTLIAPARLYKADENIIKRESKKTISETCPFCPGHEYITPMPELYARLLTGEECFRRTQIASNWILRVIPHKFPFLKIEGEVNGNTDIIFTSLNSVGAHEIIVDYRSHNTRIHELRPENINHILKAAIWRYFDLKNDPRFKYFLFCKNYRKEAGCGIDHIHSQIIALPIIPPKTQLKIQSFRDYNDRLPGRCALCDYLNAEIEQYDGIRLIEDNEHFIAVAPFASEWPYKTIIAPKEHHPSWALDFEQPSVLNSFSLIFLNIMKRINKITDDAPYNIIFFNAPYASDSANGKLHWHVEIIPRIYNQGSIELAAGIYINPVSPEDAALKMRRFIF